MSNPLDMEKLYAQLKNREATLVNRFHFEKSVLNKKILIGRLSELENLIRIVESIMKGKRT